MVRKTGGFCPRCGKVWGRMFGFGRVGESEGEAGHRSPSTKKRQTPKWRQIGGAILTPFWWRELDLNQRPFGYEPNELPGCSIPRRIYIIAQVVSFGKGFLGLFWILEDFGVSGEGLRGVQGGSRGENEVKKRRQEVDVEGVGEAGKEVEGNEVGEQEGDEQRKGGVRAEAGAAEAREAGEIEHEEEKGDADEAEFEEEAEELVLDDFFGGGDEVGVERVHSSAGAAETDAEEDGPGGVDPGAEGGGAEAEADVGGFGDVAVKDGVGGGVGGGFGGFGVCGGVGDLGGGVGGGGAEINQTEREVMDGFGDAGEEGFGGGAEGGESALNAEDGKEGSDGDE